MEVILRSGLAGIHGAGKGPWEIRLDRRLGMRSMSALGIWTYSAIREELEKVFKLRYGILRVGI